MSFSFGTKWKVTIFGQSHSEAIGVVIDGIPSGFALDKQQICFEMSRRAPGQSSLATARKEADMPEILCGEVDSVATGTALCAIIRNTNTRSQDYEQLKSKMRPGHADYTGYVKYGGFHDVRGGGHFSGRLTAPLVFAGAVAKQVLAARGVQIFGHIQTLSDVHDKPFDPVCPDLEQMQSLCQKDLPVLDPAVEEPMRQRVFDARKQGDSVGGVVEVLATGVPAGLGDPFFDSVESVLSHLIFSVPAVKGVEFGSGFDVAQMCGSQCNDSFYYEGDTVKTRTNHNGGILGGITNGMPVVFRAAVKPTPSVAKPQQTIDISKKEDCTLSVGGRHDPCIVPRAVPVLEAVMALGLCEFL